MNSEVALVSLLLAVKTFTNKSVDLLLTFSSNLNVALTLCLKTSQFELWCEIKHNFEGDFK